MASLWSFEGRYRVLHLTWFAFFLSFVVWFNFAPFVATIGEQLGLSKGQKITLGLCNVALTVPARIFIGMLLDRFGPRRMYAAILLFAALPCTMFALATSFELMVASRLLLSVVGAGFVVGIRMVSEWFPPREVGTAEGVYGGWGNFGSAAAAFALPILAGIIGGADGWRWSVGSTGVIAAVYALVYLRAVRDTPDGVVYIRPKRQGALEVTSPSAVYGLAALVVPLNAVLVIIAWRVWREGVIGDSGLVLALVAIGALLTFQLAQVFRVNRPARRDEYHVDDRYPLRTVAALSVAYFCTFGSELAVVTMLPDFFAGTWGLGPALAGAAASGFAFMNLIARPTGGIFSDVLGSRKRTLGVLLVGLALGYGLMSLVGSTWPVPVAIAVCMVCSFFVQSGEGAVFAIVPIVKKRVSGQIAGMAGAYGNVGAICFLTSRLWLSDQAFFLLIAGASIVAIAVNAFIVEPKHSFSAHLLVDTHSAAGDHEVPVRTPVDVPA